MNDRPDRTRRTRADYERGLPDHHDPTAGFAGASPARSALTLRAVLAAFGLVFCAGAAWFAFAAGLAAALAVEDHAEVDQRDEGDHGEHPAEGGEPG